MPQNTTDSLPARAELGLVFTDQADEVPVTVSLCCHRKFSSNPTLFTVQKSAPINVLHSANSQTPSLSGASTIDCRSTSVSDWPSRRRRGKPYANAIPKARSSGSVCTRLHLPVPSANIIFETLDAVTESEPQPSVQHEAEICPTCHMANARDKNDIKEAKDERRNQVRFGFRLDFRCFLFSFFPVVVGNHRI